MIFVRFGSKADICRRASADLPVELPTKISLLVNLQCAKTLGVEVPLSLLIRADELLE